MNLVPNHLLRHAEAVFVATAVVACSAAFYDGSAADRAAQPVQVRRVAQLIAVPSMPVVIVRARRPVAAGKAAAAAATGRLAPEVRI